MAEDRMKILEERLTRLESTLAQRASGISGGGGGFTAVPGTISDPPPWQLGNWTYYPRRVPSPVVDPAPWPGGGWGGGWGGWRPPITITDPPPWPGFVVDPAPQPQVFDPNLLQSAAASLGRRIVSPIDPPPPDLTRLTVIQLESALHSIAAEKARLDSMEQMVKKQLETAKKQQPG